MVYLKNRGMETVAPAVLLALFAVALIAGSVDAIAGGGGLLTLPALLLAQIPPVHAMATNKLQSSFGTFTSAMSMRRKGLAGPVDMQAPFLFALAGSAVGTVTVQFIDTRALTVVVPVVLAGIAIYFIAMPKRPDRDVEPRLALAPYNSLVVPGIGFYDGAFGPGTGSFFTAAGVSLRGQRLVPASAQARMLNFATNVASLVVFAIGGKTMWLVGGIMAVGSMSGAYLGALAVSRGGARLIRPIVVVMCLGMLVQYLWRQGWLPF
ncbi:protein of unknown function DUF81 [Stackebrandtia nassauensis DSM 44728]|uniref:Probable membrane transporter protein n=2 Tax=Stackebrandtia TaxID=283810 RepID=D3PVX9_STANL|nr:protein of unknown function DUF81 [Stackebrandtia nassauensis DSM 44728]